MWSLECCYSREAIVTSHAVVMPAPGHAREGRDEKTGSPGLTHVLGIDQAVSCGSNWVICLVSNWIVGSVCFVC